MSKKKVKLRESEKEYVGKGKKTVKSRRESKTQLDAAEPDAVNPGYWEDTALYDEAYPEWDEKY